jgi:hypothetical protein
MRWSSDQHTIQARRGRLSSPLHPFEAGDGELITFQMHGPMVFWSWWLLSLLVPSLGISVRRL